MKEGKLFHYLSNKDSIPVIERTKIIEKYINKIDTLIKTDSIFIEKSSNISEKEIVKKISFWDNLKNQFCEDNSINLLRIPYTDYGKLNKNDDYLMRKINEATS